MDDSEGLKHEAPIDDLSATGPKGPTSALLQAAAGNSSISLAAIFSGQGADYLNELRDTCARSTTAQRFVIDASAALLEEAASEDNLRLVHEHGFALLDWMKGDEPPIEYLRSAPISYPLVFLTQIANYLAAIDACDTSHSALTKSFKCATGHSQGIVAAVVLASSGDGVSLHAKSLKGVRYMFWHGVRVGQTFSAAPTDGAGTPMLAVTGVPHEQARSPPR